MSYETCLAIRQYKDEAEKEAVHKEAFLKMQEYVDKDGNYFDESEWRKNCFDFDKKLEIYASDSTMSLTSTHREPCGVVIFYIATQSE